MKKKFSIKFTRPIVGKRFGVFQHIMKGVGSEKTDVRKYSPGDNASHINRKLSAKYQELYTNIFQQEKSLNLDMFFDINYNRIGGNIPNKEQVLCYGEDIISYCQHQQIALNFFYPQQKFFGGASLKEHPIKKNSDSAITTFHHILATTSKTTRRYTSLLNNFLQLAASRPSRRAIVIFSDFLTLDEEQKKLIHYLQKHHIVFLFQLPVDHNQGQNYNRFFLTKKFSSSNKNGTKISNEIELLQID